MEYIPNKGQWEEKVLFKAELGSGTIFLLSDGIVFDFVDPKGLESLHHLDPEDWNTATLRHHAWKVSFNNCNAVTPHGEGQKKVYYNYFLGNDQKKWAVDIHPCQKVIYENLWDGIDMVVHSANGNFKYDFEVHPGADPDSIQMEYDGVKPLLDGSDLLLETFVGSFREAAPVAWQNAARRVLVTVTFKVKGNHVQFKCNPYENTKTLVIDPFLIAGTYAGAIAPSAVGSCSTYDVNGEFYMGIYTTNNSLPTTFGAFDTTQNGFVDIGISKFTDNGSELIWCSYLGGSSTDLVLKLFADSDHHLNVLSSTQSSNFPVSIFAFDSAFGPFQDYAISVISESGDELIASTFFGGELNDGATSQIEVFDDGWYPDKLGEVTTNAIGDIITATTTKILDYPFQNLIGFPSDDRQLSIASFKPDLTALNWLTVINSPGEDNLYDLKILPSGNILICGSSNDSLPIPEGAYQSQRLGGYDGFLFILSPDAGEILYGTWFGLIENDYALFTDVDPEGRIWVCGVGAGEWPVVGEVYANPGSWQYIACFSPDLTQLVSCSPIGSGFPDEQDLHAKAFMVDDCGKIFYCASNDADTLFSDLDISEGSISPQGGYYLAVYSSMMEELEYGSYLAGAHNHSGSSRYDKKGIAYQAMCSCDCCGNPATPWAYSQVGSGCEATAVKIDFETSSVVSAFGYHIISSCFPLVVEFENFSDSGFYSWNFGDGLGWLNNQDTLVGYEFTEPGNYLVQLAVQNDQSCNLFDTTQVVLHVPDLLESTLLPDWQVTTGDLCNESTDVLAFFNGQGADNLSWTLDGMAFSENDTVNFNLASPGSYLLQLIAEDTVCNYAPVLSEFIHLGPPVEAMIDQTDSIPACAPANIGLISGSVNNQTLAWYLGNDLLSSDDTLFLNLQSDTSFTVTLIASNEASCNIADTSFFDIIILAPSLLLPDWEIMASDSCADELVISGSYTGSGETGWEWIFDNGTSTDPSIELTYDQPNTYTISLAVFDSTCEISDTLSSTFILAGTVHAVIEQDIFTGCVPLDVQFSAEGGTTWQWSLAEEIISSEQSFQHHFSEAGTYIIQLQVTEPGTCNFMDSVQAIVEVISPMYNASWTVTESQVPCSGTAFVEGNFEGFNATSLWWQSGNGQFSSSDTVLFSYTFPGDYLLQLVAENEFCGQVETFSETISVDEPGVIPDFIIPTIFTPNGDQLNDTWQIVPTDSSASFSNWSLKIFNRWGRLLFESNDPLENWNAQYQGNPVAGGTYLFILEYSDDCTESSVVKSGNVQVLR